MTPHRLLLMLAMTATITLSGCQRNLSDAELLASAEQSWVSGDSKTAIIELKNALQRNSDNAEARALLGHIYLANGDPLSAEKELSRAAALEAEEPRVYLDLYETYLALRRYEEVTTQLQPETFKDVNDRSYAYALLAGAYAGQGHRFEADQLYLESLNLADNARSRAGLLVSALDAGELDQASTLLQSALETYPDDFDVNLAATRYQVEVRNFDKAILYISAALKTREDARAHLTKAELLLSQGDIDLAQEEVDKAIILEPKNVFVNYIQAKIDYQKGEYESAQNNLEQVVLSAPNHAPTLLLLGAVYAELGQTETALQYLQRYNTQAPASLTGAMQLAQIYWKKELWAEAEKVLFPLLTTHPDDIPLLTLATSVMVRQGKLNEASPYFQRLAQLQPESVMAQYYVGATQYATGETQEGIATLEKVVANDSSIMEARMILMKTYLETAQIEKARGLAKSIRDSDPTLPIGWNYLGLVSETEGDTSQAIKFYESALEQAPSDPDANGKLAAMARKAGELEKAQAYYDKIYEQHPTHFLTRVANASLFTQKQDHLHAIEQLELASQSIPTDLRTNLLLANYYLQYGQYKEAVRVLSILQRAYPANIAVTILLSDSLLKLGLVQNTLDILAVWQETGENSPEIYARKAHAQILTRSYQKAQRTLERALEIDRQNIAALIEQCRLHIARKELAQAGKLIEALNLRSPGNSQILARAGDVEFARENYEKAIQYYQEANAINAESDTIISLGKALWQAKRADEMLETYTAWLQALPNDRATRYQLAQGYRLMKNDTAANAELKVLLEDDPLDSKVLNTLAWNLRQTDPTQALALAEKAVGLAPQHPQVLDTLGVILYTGGDLKGGIEALRRALKRAPDDPEIQFHLAQALAANGDSLQAQDILTKLIAAGDTFADYDAAAELSRALAK